MPAEIIDELEPERRGIYGGGMGYLDFGGNMDICITIRTMVKKNNRVYIQAGGGIVADSVLDNEFQETVNKAGACHDSAAHDGRGGVRNDFDYRQLRQLYF